MSILIYSLKQIRISSRYISSRKSLNWFRLLLSYLFSLKGKEIIFNRLPFFISIEITNFCNLHCPECPVGTNTLNLQKKVFNYNIYAKLIDELKPTLAHVILYFQGEPFLCKTLDSFIKYAHQSGIYTSTSTNGQFLSSESAKKIVLSGLDKLIVSIDGSTQETYETYRVGGSLQKTVDGITHVNKWKKELKSITPLIEIQFLVLKSNEHQIAEIEKLAKTLKVDKLSYKTAQLNDYKEGNALMPTIERLSRYKKGNDQLYHLKNKQPNHCSRLWHGAVVNVNGEVLPCCFDKSSEFSFGNINNKSFFDIWNNEKASGFRSKVLQNRKQFNICRNCTSKN